MLLPHEHTFCARLRVMFFCAQFRTFQNYDFCNTIGSFRAKTCNTLLKQCLCFYYWTGIIHSSPPRFPKTILDIM